jgi:thiol:disulfide interchange protein
MHKLGFWTIPATVVFRPNGMEPRVMLEVVNAEQLITELEQEQRQRQ